LPRNLISKKPYRGANLFLLSASNYVSPYWLTIRQSAQLSGYIRKGEKGTLIVYRKIEGNEPTDLDTQEMEQERRFLLRSYRVWNVEQCDLSQKVLDKLPRAEVHEHSSIEASEQIVAAMPMHPEIVRAGSKAFYNPVNDRITLPPSRLFISAEEEACTTLHEISHASGHPKRLNRPSITEAAPFGSPTYSLEEIIAEMSAAYLCAEAGISPAVIQNESAYIQGWLRRLRSERRFLVRTATHANERQIA
jgi:antirestriction protein ArdC